MKTLDYQRLIQEADTRETRLFVEGLPAERERIKAINQMSHDDSLITLAFQGLCFTVRKSNAFSAVETYCEIFHRDNHCLHPDFIPSNSDVIVDFGANQGFYVAKIKKIAPSAKVFAFEPNPWEYSLLEQNCRNNDFQNVILDYHAIYDRAVELTMEVIPQIGAIGSTDIHHPSRTWLKEEFIKKITVQAISADQALEKYKLDHVDIMKIDVEGAEWEILSQFQLIDRVQKLVIEWHSHALRAKVLSLLVGKGFRLVFEDAVQGDYYGEFYLCR